MKLPFSISRRAARMLVISLLGGVAMTQAIAGAKADGEVGSESYGGTLTFGGATSDNGRTPMPVGGGTVASTAGGWMLITDGSMLTFNGSTFTSNGSTTTPTAPALTGSVDGLKYKADADGGVKKVKATVSLTNHLDEVLHDVTATVYLSDDATLSSDDVKLATLKLADFVAKGKIGKHKTLSMPFKHKVPAVLATYLEGKYLIVTLDSKDLDASIIPAPIVIGPIALP